MGMMNCLLIACTHILGLASDTNASVVGGGQNGKMDRESSLPNNLLDRRAQEQEFFAISMDIISSTGSECFGSERASMDAQITQLLLDFGFGDMGNSTDPASGICENIPPSDPVPSLRHSVVLKYVWYRSGPCVNRCSLRNSDGRMLSTTAEAISAAVKSGIETTLLPYHPTCFGVNPVINVDVKEVTAAEIQEYCAIEVPPEPISDNLPVSGTVGGVVVSLPPPTPAPSSPTTAPAPYTYEVPDWWDRVIEQEADDDLKMCKKRQYPPTTGTECASKPKTCYWGNQQCDGGALLGVFPYPVTHCHCDGSTAVVGIWTCTPLPCAYG